MATRPMRCRRNRRRTWEAGCDIGEGAILPVLLRWICDFAAGVNDGHVRAGSVTVQVVIRITVPNQRGKGEASMFSKHTAESPTARDRSHKVMPAAIKWQLIVTRYAQALAYIEVRIAFIDGLREWVGLLKTDLVRREVDGVAPSVQGRNGEAASKGMRKLGDHRIEASVDVGKWYEDPVEVVVADDNGGWTSGICRTAEYTVCAGALHSIHIAVESVTRVEPI